MAEGRGQITPISSLADRGTQTELTLASAKGGHFEQLHVIHKGYHIHVPVALLSDLLSTVSGLSILELNWRFL